MQRGRFTLSPLNRRRAGNFKRNRRGYWSLWIFLILFVLSLFAEFIANDRPIIVSYKGETLLPVFVNYPEEKFGGFLATTDYRDPFIQDEIQANGWMVWAPIRYSFRTVNNEIPTPAPSEPWWLMSPEDRCQRYPGGVDDANCTPGNWHWLGSDDQARDVVARMIYGFRISVLFGLTLTAISSVIGVVAGAVQGYFGGWIDLLFQRFIEIWTSTPGTFSADHHLLGDSIELLRAPGHPAPVLLADAGRFGPRGIPARTQSRVRYRRAGTRRRQPRHHVPAPSA